MGCAARAPEANALIVQADPSEHWRIVAPTQLRDHG
jgi:hypothetical protein